MNIFIDDDKLEKALDKSKLVQVERMVQGKNGTYRRKQWVKASDVKKTDIVVGGQQAPDSSKTMTDKEFYKKYPTGGYQNPEDCLKNNGSNATWKGEKLSNPDVMKKAKKEYKEFLEDKKAFDNWKNANAANNTKKPTTSKASGDFVEYTLTWKDSKGDGHHYKFDSIDELKDKLKYKGLPESLADFKGKKVNKNGYAENSYQNYSVCAYPDTPDDPTPSKPQKPLPDHMKQMLERPDNIDIYDKHESQYKGLKIQVGYSGKITITDKSGKEVYSTYSKQGAADFLEKQPDDTSNSLGTIDKDGDLVVNDKDDLGEYIEELTGADMFDQKDAAITELEKTEGMSDITVESMSIDKASVDKNGNISITAVVNGYYGEDEENFGDTYVTFSLPMKNKPSNKKDISKMTDDELKNRMKEVTSRMSQLQSEMSNNAKAAGQLNSNATAAQKKEYDDLVDENGELMVELGKRNKPANKNASDTGKEVLKVRDALDSSGTATTTSKEVADMYKQNKNPNMKFTVKDNKDGSYTITSSKQSAQSTSGKSVDEAKAIVKKMSVDDAKKFATDNGITWEENAHSGINTMRMKMAIQKAIQEGKVQAPDSSNMTPKTANASKPSAGTKKPQDAAKKAVQDVVGKNPDKAKTMEMFKANGITWKESDKEGINWMRAMMAATKHVADGGSLDADASDEDDYMNTDPTVDDLLEADPYSEIIPENGVKPFVKTKNGWVSPDYNKVLNNQEMLNLMDNIGGYLDNRGNGNPNTKPKSKYSDASGKLDPSLTNGL